MKKNNNKVTQSEANMKIPAQQGDISRVPPEEVPDIHQSSDNSKTFTQETDFLLIMDSNRKFIDFRKLLKSENIKVIPCGNISKAEEIDTQKFNCPKNIILHVGVNDVDVMFPEILVDRLTKVASWYKRIFPSSNVFISGITPRKGSTQASVAAVNSLLINNVRNSEIHYISHNNLNPSHLHDDRNLRRNKLQNEAFSGLQMLCKNFYECFYNEELNVGEAQSCINFSRNQTSRNQLRSAAPFNANVDKNPFHQSKQSVPTQARYHPSYNGASNPGIYQRNPSVRPHHQTIQPTFHSSESQQETFKPPQNTQMIYPYNFTQRNPYSYQPNVLLQEKNQPFVEPTRKQLQDESNPPFRVQDWLYRHY